uniref:IMD domain-containing protein n=1 Tax=Glossina brevipalpis TaxID=37001 RepID=A0A1A9W9K9_9MUSC
MLLRSVKDLSKNRPNRFTDSEVNDDSDFESFLCILLCGFYSLIHFWFSYICRAAIQAIAAYLDAFQKIADAATNSRGASKEIGTALTRVCLRHKAVETRLKTFTAAIMDCLVQPLQEKLEDWKRSVATIDKEHAKEYKRCRTELKKRSTDTLRLQKKARKGQSGTLQSLMDSHMQDVTLRRAELEEVEKKSLRSAMIEERMRYCNFVHMLQPVVKEECEVMSELGHLQEAMQSIALVTKDPHILPAASEELIHDAKASINLYPESPGGGGGGGGGPGTQPGCSNSLGSRKSSVCSISSMNSSGSSNSPGHPHYPRSMSQLIPPTIRLKPGESSDSGFCSSPALTTQASAANNSVHINSTWPPHSQDAAELPSNADRPHTISSAYEKGHQRPPLTVYTFQNPETINESSGSVNNASNTSGPNTPSTQKSPAGAISRPPLPVRCSSLERPLVGNNSRGNSSNLLQRQCPSPIPAHVTKAGASHHSTPPNQTPAHPHQPQYSRSQSTNSSSNASSLHSHPSIESTVATSLQGQTPTPSSGSSTPQNHYSPLLTNSPSSTAAGTPSGASITSGGLTGNTGCGTGGSGGFVYNICSPTPPHSANTSSASDILKITETDSGQGVPNHSTTHQYPNVISPQQETVVDAAPNTQIVNNQETSSPSKVDSCSSIVENDERSRASVLQKASMFEKQAAAVKNTPPPPSAVTRGTPTTDSSIYGTRSSQQHHGHHQYQHHQQQPQAIDQQEVDKCFEDSIQELNNLIGELDSFQREIDASKQPQQPQQQQQKTQQLSPVASADSYDCNETMTIITDENSTTIICEQPNHSQPQMLTKHHLDCCSASNQTNSSGCGTDISDTTSDDCGADTQSITSLNYHNNNNNNVNNSNLVKRNLKSLSEANYNSDSELSRCYVSETSSLMGRGDGDGYENPTFALFAATSSSSIAFEDNRSDSAMMPTRQAYVDNASDNGSGVVVIYDHQPPITPDIDYVKQNSEIVMLRTKPQQQMQYQQEVCELQQLPANLCENLTSPSDGSVQHVATVAPAKQRLSSFRASSEQLQLLNNNTMASKGMQNSNSKIQENGERVITQGTMTAMTAQSSSDTIIRRKLPPKPPMLSVLNGKRDVQSGLRGSKPLELNNAIKEYHQSLKKPLNVDFKTDLEAKILKQKQKLLLQEQQEKHQQRLQRQSSSHPLPKTFNVECNAQSAITAAQAIPSSLSITIAETIATPSSASLPSSQLSLPSNASHSNNTSNHPLNSSSTIKHHISNLSNHTNTKIPVMAVHSLNVVANSSTPLPPPLPPSNSDTAICKSPPTATLTATVGKPSITPRPASLSGGGSNTRVTRRSSVNTAKPPPPIRRSSSVTPSPNAPTTPTHPNSTNLLHHQTHSLNTSTENLPPPPAYLLESSRHFSTIPLTSALSSPTAGTGPAGGMLNASQKVSEAVKALTALRLQAGSPHNPKRLHGDQEHLSPISPHQQSVLQSPKYQVDIYTTTTTTTYTSTSNITTPTPRSPLLLSMHDQHRFEGYSPYVEFQTTVANNNLTPKQNTVNADAMLDLHNEFSPIYQQLSPKQYHHQHTRSSPILKTPLSLSPNNTIIDLDDDRPPPLPPPNPQHYRQQQQQQQQQKRQNLSQLPQGQCYDSALPSINSNYKLMQHMHQKPFECQEQKLLHNVNSEASFGCNSPTSFRTSSPGGIYAQPKILNNMSSFRTPSPGPNNHQAPSSIQATHIPNQPKTNPNLIAQLNARLNNKQQQSQPATATESVYGTSGANNQNNQHQQLDSDIYMRSYGQQYAQMQSQQQQQQNQQQVSIHGNRQEQLQQQHTYDGKSIENIKSKVYGSFSTSSPITSSSSSSSTTTTTATTTTAITHHISHTGLTASASFNASPHFPLSSSTSSLLSKVTSFSKETPQSSSSGVVGKSANITSYHTLHSHCSSSPSSANTTTIATTTTASASASHYYPSTNSQNAVVETNSNRNQNQYSTNLSNSGQYYAPKHSTIAGGTSAHHQSGHVTASQRHSQLHQRESQPHQQTHYTCPPPLENPPPPPFVGNNNTATMPKRGSGGGGGLYHQQQQQAKSNVFSSVSSSATLPKRLHQQHMQQQQQQQQQQHQHGLYGIHSVQQQQYHAPAAITATAGSGQHQSQQYQTSQSPLIHRPPMPLPHEHSHLSPTSDIVQYNSINKQKISHKQPPIPSRHSSAQQKIFVATNPFMQTTTTSMYYHSSEAQATANFNAHSQPVSSLSNSPTPSSSVASIYGTSSRRSSASASGVGSLAHSHNLTNSGHYEIGGNGGGSSAYYNHHHNSSHNSNYASAVNTDKTGSIRTKAKAEFLENLNAKLAKQGLSGRAFAVRNLINSKALPDPRICHESLMDQIKRGATLKRNQKINDRSAPKIY